MGNIKQPRDERLETSIGAMQVKWGGGAASRINAGLKAKQNVIDSEVLRLCGPLVPKKTGNLERSGIAKGGEVDYTANYARKQYYDTAETRSYDARRGGKWFQRMKTQYKQQILDKAQKT